MSVTARFGSSVKRNITRFGKLVSYNHLVTGEYDPDTGAISTSTEVSLKAFRTQVSESEAKSPNLVGKEVSAFLIAGVDISFTPKAGDTITMLDNNTSTTLKLLAVKEYWAGDEVAMYRVLCEFN